MKLFTLKYFATFLLMSVIALCACSAGDMVKTYNMQNCEYAYKSTTNVTISNINVSKGISVSDAPKLLLLLNSQNQPIPLNFLLTLDVKNPNKSDAAFHGMAYKVNIDGIDFTEGSVDEPFNVASGETKPLSIKIGTDVAQLIEKNYKDAVMNVVKNFIGLSNEKTNVRVDLRPKFLAAGKTVTSPKTFPVNFSFGGK